MIRQSLYPAAAGNSLADKQKAIATGHYVYTPKNSNHLQGILGTEQANVEKRFSSIIVM